LSALQVQMIAPRVNRPETACWYLRSEKAILRKKQNIAPSTAAAEPGRQDPVNFIL